MSAHIKGGDRKRPHFFLYFFRIEGMYQIGLFKIRCHFGKDFPVGNPDVHGIPEFFKDGIFYFGRGQMGRPIPCGNRRIIHIAFIYAYLLNIRADMEKEIHQFGRALAVQRMVWRVEEKMRAFTHGIDNRLPGLHAISLRRNRFGQYHTMTFFHIPSYNRRNLPQINISASR